MSLILSGEGRGGRDDSDNRTGDRRFYPNNCLSLRLRLNGQIPQPRNESDSPLRAEDIRIRIKGTRRRLC